MYMLRLEVQSQPRLWRMVKIRIAYYLNYYKFILRSLFVTGSHITILFLLSLARALFEWNSKERNGTEWNGMPVVYDENGNFF